MHYFFKNYSNYPPFMSALFWILTKLSNHTCLIGTREYVPKLNLVKTDSVHRAGARFAYGENADQVRKWHECTCSSLKSPFCRRQKFLMSVPYCSSSSSSKNESQTDTIFSPYSISNTVYIYSHSKVLGPVVCLTKQVRIFLWTKYVAEQLHFWPDLPGRNQM